MEKVRGSRQALQKVIDSAPAEENRTRERNAAMKVQSLEDELDQALAGKPEELPERLRTLAERLTVKPRPAAEGDREIERTPTITTIVEHRQ